MGTKNYTSYEYDVFISYAHIDDGDPLQTGAGWVTRFVRHFEQALRSYLGAQFEIFFDPGVGAGNVPLPYLLKAAANSAIYIGIGSPAFTQRPWVGKELGAFNQTGACDARSFLVECMPLDGDVYPTPMDRKIAKRFWTRVENTDAAIALTEADPRFHLLVTEVAKAAEIQLKALRRNVPADQPPSSTRRILIAQGTDSVEAPIEELRRYLTQFPEAVTLFPPHEYPLGGDTFRAAFQEDLKDADIVVQLLGDRPGRKPPDLPQGFTCYQAEAAAASGKPVLQWRHPELVVSDSVDPIYRALINSPSVTVCGFEEFKAMVLDVARKRDPVPSDAAPDVFISADRYNLDVADSIGSECNNLDFSFAMPLHGPTTSDNRRHLLDHLTSCDVILFVHGSGDRGWLSSQRNTLDSRQPLRKTPPKAIAVCTVPPGEAPGHDFMGVEFDDIDCSDDYDLQKVRTFLTNLASRLGRENPVMIATRNGD